VTEKLLIPAAAQVWVKRPENYLVVFFGEVYHSLAMASRKSGETSKAIKGYIHDDDYPTCYYVDLDLCPTIKHGDKIPC
jgi:hypothetical protein